MMAKRKMSLTELSQNVGITMANLSKLKNNKAKAIRFSLLDLICDTLDCQPSDIIEFKKMKTKILIVTALLLATTLTGQEKISEKEIIKNTIETAYIAGLQNEGEQVKIESGFHPDFYLLGIDQGDTMWHYSINDWKEKAIQKRKNGVLPLTGDKKVSAIYKSIDITENAAVVKLEYYVNKKQIFTDYLSLYKFESGWKIVSKIFYKHQ